MGHPKRYRRASENRPFRRQLIVNTVASGMSKFVALPIVEDAADLMAQTQLLVRYIMPAIL